MEKLKTVFRSSLGGFNKQDVNNYISELSENFAAREKEHLDEIASLREKLSAAEEKNISAASLSAELDNAKSELSKSEAVIAANREELEKKDNEISALGEALNETKAKLISAEEKLEVLSSSEEKLREYDRMSAKVGELMVNASASADRIKSEAQFSADETLRVAKEKEKQLIDEYNKTLSDLNSKLKGLAEGGMNDIAESMRDAQRKIDSIMTDQRIAVLSAIEKATDFARVEQQTKISENTEG